VNYIKLAESRGELSLAARAPGPGTTPKVNVELFNQLTAVAKSEPGSDPLSSPPPQTGPEPETPPKSDLQQIRDELRGLHGDVRRLIEILEQHKHNESRESPQGASVPPILTEPKGKLTALFFSADWCGPCQKMTPIVNRLTTQHGCTIRTINIDADREMAEVFAIRSLPTFVILDDGRVVDRIVGLTSEERLKQALSRNLDTDTEVGESSASDLAWEVLGLRLSPAKDDGFADGGPYRGGVEVAAVRPDSPAASQTIRVGDILVGLHVWETKSLENVNYVLHHQELSKFLPLKFYLVRDRETVYGTLNLDSMPPKPHTDQSKMPLARFVEEGAGAGIRAQALGPVKLPTD